MQSHARRTRRDTTPAERALWRLLRDDALGLRFRRQHPVPPYIADFACLPARLVVEIDGWTHTDPAADAARDVAPAVKGWRVLRFTNTDVLENASGVAEAIRQALVMRLAGTPPP
ncbi:endonuclease domain-containing protein [Roseicella aquatilis]|uniref:Endonuclease domain-containing protein n=1 Tax=Roseicella aquatilis TaxID=2527868 RepID=A0A4R4DTN7_9PROT|nr:endonuclease domain-containing protein [Roseicella aquatilis]TCZ63553.1 endonuclease domain-containing protein [Roseicella aquatilis]